MPLLFAHGLESGPVGRKSQALREAGYEVVAPDCRGEELGERVRRLVEVIVSTPGPPLVVGSSFGGIAGLVAAQVAAERHGVVVPGLVLCAPALMLPPPPDTVPRLRPPAATIIVHGLRDEVIPIAHSRAFAREHGSTVRLHEVDDDHRLAGAGLAIILAAVRSLVGPPPDPAC